MKRLLIAAAALMIPTFATADTFQVAATNGMTEEHLTQLVIGAADQEQAFWDAEGTLTEDAQILALKGWPQFLALTLGEHGAILNGPDQIKDRPHQTLPLNALSDDFSLNTNEFIIMAMVGTEVVPDHYLIGRFDMSEADTQTITLDRFDLGTEDGEAPQVLVGPSKVTVTLQRVE